MFPPSVQGLSCPGCAPGDVPQPHICGRGAGLNLITGFCYRCNQSWAGSHACLKVSQIPAIAAPAPLTLTPAAAACDHCWCLRQKAGWYDVPSPTTYFGKESQRLKAHKVCCNCGNRRVRP